MNNNNKVSDNFFNDKDENISISSNNLGDRRFLENNNEENNKFSNLNMSKLTANGYNNNSANKKILNSNNPIPSNLWEDSIHTKFKNLELTNDDLDDMFNVFTDNKMTKFNKK